MLMKACGNQIIFLSSCPLGCTILVQRVHVPNRVRVRVGVIAVATVSGERNVTPTLFLNVYPWMYVKGTL